MGEPEVAGGSCFGYTHEVFEEADLIRITPNGGLPTDKVPRIQLYVPINQKQL